MIKHTEFHSYRNSCDPLWRQTLLFRQQIHMNEIRLRTFAFSRDIGNGTPNLPAMKTGHRPRRDYNLSCAAHLSNICGASPSRPASVRSDAQDQYPVYTLHSLPKSREHRHESAWLASIAREGVAVHLSQVCTMEDNCRTYYTSEIVIELHTRHADSARIMAPVRGPRLPAACPSRTTPSGASHAARPQGKRT